jgi:hypothetical protein
MSNMKTIIIAENLINDYCGSHIKFVDNYVNIGSDEIDRLMGEISNKGNGPLPSFLHDQFSKGTEILFFRDFYQNEDEIDADHMDRFGEHGIANTSGTEFPNYVSDLVEKSTVFNCKGLAFPIKQFRSYMLNTLGIDVLSESNAELRSKVKFIILGFHTERRVFVTANIIRNLFGFNNVAVLSHFLTGFSKEAHFSMLRYTFPDNLIQVLGGIDEIKVYLDEDIDSLSSFDLSAVSITPEEIRTNLSPEQKKIVESICMHWTEVNLKPMSGGFSGSALFLANGKQGKANTEPMVIKIDNHNPIRNEIRGYNLVKDFLGKHIPTFTFPVSRGPMSGIGMELATMEGAPNTLQDFFEKISNDYQLDEFIKLLNKVLVLHVNRVYKNTELIKSVVPFRHFMLHISEQSKWLEWNIENIFSHKTDKVIVSEDVILSIFNLVRKNTDSIPSQMCIAHGDLNLANIIVDNQDNIWTIDWTHAGYHPIEIDFAKMENDIKFVLCKELGFDDLPNLKELEDLFLENLVLEDVDELPLNFGFIKWDIRFKKIYRAVRELRKAYSKLKEGENWLFYKISLLRYALHNLSFDNTKDQGECSPPQLWYALISVENLCFQLVADDYHLQIRSEKPDEYPNRFRIQIDLANWKVKVESYNPPYYVSQDILKYDNNLTFANRFDSEDNWEYSDLIDWGSKYVRDDKGKPLNPRGRTGIQGRGSLRFWGNNPMLYLALIRYNKEERQLEVLLNTEKNNNSLINVHFRRNESLSSAIERTKEKLNFNVLDYSLDEVHEGYLYDLRQTDNAWVEAKSYLLFDNSEIELIHDIAPGMEWKTVSPSLINNMYSSQGNILRECVQYIFNEKSVEKEFVAEILNKTG